jgi:hypothetical protein
LEENLDGVSCSIIIKGIKQDSGTKLNLEMGAISETEPELGHTPKYFCSNCGFMVCDVGEDLRTILIERGWLIEDSEDPEEDLPVCTGSLSHALQILKEELQDVLKQGEDFECDLNAISDRKVFNWAHDLVMRRLKLQEAVAILEEIIEVESDRAISKQHSEEDEQNATK